MTEEQNKLADCLAKCKLHVPQDKFFHGNVLVPTDLLANVIDVLHEPATEAVLVPRDALILWACYLEDADSRLGPYLLGAKRDTSYKEAAEEIRLRLAGTFSCPHCGITTPHEHSVDRKGNALKGKGASQGADMSGLDYDALWHKAKEEARRRAEAMYPPEASHDRAIAEIEIAQRLYRQFTMPPKEMP